MAGDIYIFAGGGSGGHLYPGLAVAEQLLADRPDARVVFACSNRTIDRAILDPLACAVVPQPVRPLPRGPLAGIAFLKAWIASRRQSRRMIRDLKPKAVLGLGGFAAAPMIHAAHRAGVRTALLNPDAVPGRANCYLAGRADVIFTQFSATTESFSARVQPKIRAVGCPVRASVTQASRDDGVVHFKLRPDLRTLLVSGGSLGASALNEAMVALAASKTLGELAGKWQILHICGYTKAQAAPHPELNVVRLEYCDRMDLALAAADLAVCRGGASTVAELAATLTPSVIVPYPHHRDRQQYLNAQPLAETGGAVICAEAGGVSRDVAALRDVLLPILSDSARLDKMLTAMEGMARSHAAVQVAQWLAGEKGR